MKKVKIVTDSSATMEPGIKEKYDIHMVSLSVMVDDVIYDDSELTGEEFMKMMAQSKALPKTSQPPIGEFVELYDKLGEDGSSIISIHLTELLSGTVGTARQAAQLSKSDVTVIDSTFTDQGLSFQVVRAAKMALEGATKEEIIAKVEEIRRNSKLYIGVASLENLAKGGRISRATGVISSLFNVRVVMQLTHSELVAQSKGRGLKAFHKWFEEFKKEIEPLTNIKEIAIAHADGLDVGMYFKEGIQQIFPDMHVPVLQTKPIISTHTGKGAFAIMYYTE